MNETNPQPQLSNEPTQTTPKPKSKGCMIFSIIGCIWIFLVVFLGAAALGVWYYYDQNKTDYDWDDYNYNYNDNWNWNYNDNYNYNYDLNDNWDYNYDNNWNYNLNTNDDWIFNYDENANEIIDEDGVSQGFEITTPIAENLYAYQIGAYAEMDKIETDWPAYRFTLDYPEDTKLLPDGYHGSMWIGATLDNGYFIQVGMMTSNDTNLDGFMDWTFFWEMWDDNYVYKYGLQEPLSNYSWDENEENSFTITCQNPDEAMWEFWVNDYVIGKTYTEDCSSDINNVYVFMEMIANDQYKENLPNFGPYKFEKFEYWDGYEWYPIERSVLSYSAGAVSDGTVLDLSGVCPPFGAQKVAGEDAVLFGTGLECLPQATTLWE